MSRVITITHDPYSRPFDPSLGWAYQRIHRFEHEKKELVIEDVYSLFMDNHRNTKIYRQWLQHPNSINQYCRRTKMLNEFDPNAVKRSTTTSFGVKKIDKPPQKSESIAWPKKNMTLLERMREKKKTIAEKEPEVGAPEPMDRANENYRTIVLQPLPKMRRGNERSEVLLKLSEWIGESNTRKFVKAVRFTFNKSRCFIVFSDAPNINIEKICGLISGKKWGTFVVSASQAT